MKHFLLVITVVFFSISVLSSCKKSYECNCGGQVVNAYTHKLNKSDANAQKALCEANAGCTFQRAK